MVLPRLVKKGHLKIMLYRGGEKIHRLRDRWTCANGKEWCRDTKQVLIIGLHMVGKMSLDLKSWSFSEIPNAFRELRSSLYFIFIHAHFFFLIFSLSLSLFSFFLILLPLNSKLHCTYLPPCLDICSSLGKEVIEIR
jgi:cellulose synthase/poly-beta-1,6-N-acetylglucosamine synthase-like glycosyltransferase